MCYRLLYPDGDSLNFVADVTARTHPMACCYRRQVRMLTFAPMRVFALLFACYLTLLSCLPCTDQAVRVGAPVATTLATPATGEDQHEHAADWCSPLCQCHCCTAVALPSSMAAVFSDALVPKWADRTFAELVSAAPTRAGTSAWQPPRA
jgi:hypothetical protein